MAVIEVKEFTKNYGAKEVHKGVSFQVHEGECLGLLGGSGTGKSVILRSLIGLEKADSGHVVIDGDDITWWSETELLKIRKKVAYVFQGGALFDSMSVYDNLAYPLREHTTFTEEEIENRIKSLLEEFGLEGNEDTMPSELSGGMQKRVGLLRSIILRPKVVLYDEPTAGLDPFNTKKIQEVIKELKSRKVTSIFVTHDMPSAVAVCDRIALLVDGRIGQVGTLEELKNDPNGLLQQFIDGKTR